MGDPADAVALLLGAGSGERLGAGCPKALVQLGGRALIEWSLLALAAAPSIAEIVVALPSAALGGEVEERLASVAQRTPLRCVAGGASRSESARNALLAAGASELALIHDGARPLVSAELAEQVIALARSAGVTGAIAAAPVTDTIKRASGAGGGEAPLVCETLERGSLWSVQTPQVFRRGALEQALCVDREVLARAPDDAWLIERQGGRVAIAPSSGENLKVTAPHDLDLAAALLSRRAQRSQGSLAQPAA
ncbi:MAG TPA: 2-C-methyl-D-erythritol 4-phosphate cytidylyltransferase [Solirubrobacteraceae bacterium]|nr:2-C-methyl-D-erythritol 4-phosphate cytidylyltransferase [Solirubrobacteraceae bacterium]